MTRTYTRVRQHYTTFGNLPIGARFRTDPAKNGPFVKFNLTSYEDARIGDDLAIAWKNTRVQRMWRCGIEPN